MYFDKLKKLNAKGHMRFNRFYILELENLDQNLFWLPAYMNELNYKTIVLQSTVPIL